MRYILLVVIVTSLSLCVMVTLAQETAEPLARMKAMEERIRVLEAEVQRLKGKPLGRTAAVTASTEPQEHSAAPLRTAASTAVKTKNSASSSGSEGPEFEALIERHFAAWDTLDPDSTAPFYAKDGDLIFYDLLSLKYNGWEQYKEGGKKTFADRVISRTTRMNSDLKVTHRGNIAWTSVTFHLSLKMKDGKAIEIEGRHTAVWEKRSGRWLIVHEHGSAPVHLP